MTFIIAVPVPPRRRRTTRKLTARQIAQLVIGLREAEARAIHVERDGCGFCAMNVSLVRSVITPQLPRRLRRNPEWMHQHVTMPGVRHFDRLEHR